MCPSRTSSSSNASRSPREDVKLDRGLSAQALRGLQERDLNEEEQKVGAAVATVMEEETVRLLRQAGSLPTSTRTRPRRRERRPCFRGSF